MKTLHRAMRSFLPSTKLLDSNNNNNNNIIIIIITFAVRA